MKKIFALLLMLAILCACNMPEKPAVSSESEPRTSASESSESETETSQEPEKTWLDDDDPLYYEMKAKDIYESGKHSGYKAIATELLPKWKITTRPTRMIFPTRRTFPKRQRKTLSFAGGITCH